MLAKKIAVGFGIAIILPMLVHYGVSTFYPYPNQKEYQTKHNEISRKHENLSSETNKSAAKARERTYREREEMKKLDEEWEAGINNFNRVLFFVAVPIGAIAIIVGALTSVQAIGAGLIFGGIFTLTDGYFFYWSHLLDWMRFVSLLIAFVLLIFVGYRRVIK